MAQARHLELTITRNPGKRSAPLCASPPLSATLRHSTPRHAAIMWLLQQLQGHAPVAGRMQRYASTLLSAMTRHAPPRRGWGAMGVQQVRQDPMKIRLSMASFRLGEKRWAGMGGESKYKNFRQQKQTEIVQRPRDLASLSLGLT